MDDFEIQALRQRLGFWYRVPRRWTLTREEAHARYKNISDTSEGVMNYDDLTRTPRSETNQMLVFIDRCYPAYVRGKYQWHDSQTDGGYVEAVTKRYFRRFYPDMTWENRGKYYDIIQGTIGKLSDKYDLAERTERAVNEHIYYKLRIDSYE